MSPAFTGYDTSSCLRYPSVRRAFIALCAVVGLGCAFILIAVIFRSSPGNERMRQIAGAVQEGAKAYLNRQVITISAIAVIIFILLFYLQRSSDGDWFCDRRVLFAVGRVHRDAHRRSGQRADDASRKPVADRGVAGGV